MPVVLATALVLPALLYAQTAPWPSGRAGHVMTWDPVRGETILLGGDANVSTQTVDSIWAWSGREWRFDTGEGPTWRTLPAVAFDTRRGRLVMVGGGRKITATEYGGTQGDTWEWDGNRWESRGAAGPGPVDHHAMVFDDARGVMVLQGGGADGRILDGDTWTYDGARWTRAATGADGPGQRVHHAMAWDRRRGRVVLYGGFGEAGPAAPDVWEWDGVRWHRIEAPGPGAASRHRLAYDEARGVTVLWGLEGDASTWTWDGSTWRRAATEGPPARTMHAMSYDARRGRVVLYGGGRRRADLWEWDGARWTEITAVPGSSSLQTPPAVHFEAVAFDASNGRLVLFGGSAFRDGVPDPDSPYPGQTWTWEGGAWRLAAPADRGPGSRVFHAMAYDATRRGVVLWGGNRLEGRAAITLCDTWVWSAAAWTRLTDGPCPTTAARLASLVHEARNGTMFLVEGTSTQAILPEDSVRPLRLWRLEESTWTLADDRGPRRQRIGAVAWDAVRGVLVVPVLAGPDAGVWEWDGDAWTHHRVAGPSDRLGYAFAFDPGGSRTVLVGGRSIDPATDLADAWAWDGARWTRLPDDATGPPARTLAAFVEDPNGRRLLLFGGTDARAPLTDLWAYTDGVWRLLDRR